MTKTSSLPLPPLADFTNAITVLLNGAALKTVTVFCAPLSAVKQCVRVSRSSALTFTVTYGKPNYETREYLAAHKRAGTIPGRLWVKAMPAKKLQGKKK